MAAPDIVVNNAVVRYFGAVEKFAPDHWDEALAVEVARTLSSPAANRPAGS